MIPGQPPKNKNFNSPTFVNSSSIVRYVVMFFAFIILFVTLTNTTFLTIEPGHQGVLFKRFGGGIVKDEIYRQGFHVIAPWNKMFIYDVRINETMEKMEVLSKNGLSIRLELSYRYSPTLDKIGYLHDVIGQNYLKKILIPEIRSATREVIGKYLPEELYSSQRETIQDEIFERTSKSVAEKYLSLDAVLIRDVELPKTLRDAIERKLKEEQLSLEYDFRLVKEEKDAKRRIIEAQAKADANRILNASLTKNILAEKGIEATLKLAQSSNTKVIIVGNPKNGLPLILGGN